MSERYRGPYVGVSGVGTIEQQQATAEAAGRAGLKELGYATLLGVKATDKTQMDEVSTRHGDEWFPVGSDLRTALEPGDDTLNVLQLYCSDWLSPERFVGTLGRSVSRARAWLGGLQFDKHPWMTSDYAIAQIHDAAALVDGPLILQCHRSILAECEPQAVAERLRKLEDDATHVLLDGSEGCGIRMDPEKMSRWIEAFQKSGLTMGIGVAGGLNDSMVETRMPVLLERHGAISWDAESSMHLYGRIRSDIVGLYLNASAAVLRATAPSQ